MKGERIRTIERLVMLSKIKHKVRPAHVAIRGKRIKLSCLFENEQSIRSWQYRDVHWVCEPKFRINALNAERGRGVRGTDYFVCSPGQARRSEGSQGQANDLEEIPKRAP